MAIFRRLVRALQMADNFDLIFRVEDLSFLVAFPHTSQSNFDSFCGFLFSRSPLSTFAPRKSFRAEVLSFSLLSLKTKAHLFETREKGLKCTRHFWLVREVTRRAVRNLGSITSLHRMSESLIID